MITKGIYYPLSGLPSTFWQKQLLSALGRLSLLHNAHLKHFRNVEVRVYCPHTFLS